jgi:multiple sugar transport system permease protein
MLLPALVVLFAINLAPVLDTIISSFQDYYLPRPSERNFIGITNYIDLFRDPRFLNSVGVTCIYVVATVAIETSVSVMISVTLASGFTTAKVVRGILLLPIFLTPITICFMWRVMFAPTLGVLNYFLKLVGLPPQLWVFSPDQALWSLILVGSWYRMPVMMLIIFTGLLTVPSDTIEAARVDGASHLQTLLHITLPLIKPVVMVAILFQTIDQGKWFDGIYILTRGGPGTATETMSLFSYTYAISFLKMGYSSAAAVVLSVFISVLALIIIRTGRVELD